MGDPAVLLQSTCHHENLLKALHQLRLMGVLCDVTVQVDFQGELEEFEAHQVVLAASSGYFRALLLRAEAVSKVFLSSVPTADFASFLQFVYTAKLEVKPDRVADILDMAKLLDCPDLLEACSAAAVPQDRADTPPHAPSADAPLEELPAENVAEPPPPGPAGEDEPPSRTETDGDLDSQGRRLSNRLANRKVTKVRSDAKDEDAEEPASAENDPGDGDFDQEEEEEEEEESNADEPGKGKRRRRGGRLRCNKCQRSFHYEKSFVKHVQASHGLVADVSHRCSVCQQSFSNHSNLKIHQRHVHSDERLFACDVCDKAFKRRKDVRRHARQVHEGGGDRHFCPVCGKSLSSRTALVLHERTHTGDRPYECQDCGAKFCQSSALKTHRRTHTGEKPFSCDQCDARFSQNHMLAYHKRCHTGEKPYMCESCGKSFASKEYLKHHARIHSGSKPYKCETCGRAFAQRNSLHQHTKTHTGERPYSCNDCGKQFTQLNALQRHHRIHTGEKPYMCMLCNRTFTDKSTIRRHTMTHDKDTPWKNYLVVLKGNVERNVDPKPARSAVDDQSTVSVSDGGVDPHSHGEADADKGPKAVEETITLPADWSSAAHGAITLVSHPALAGFTVIQTDVTGADSAQFITIGQSEPDTGGLCVTVQPDKAEAEPESQLSVTEDVTVEVMDVSHTPD